MKVLIGPNGMGLDKGIPDLERCFPDITFEHCQNRDGLVDAMRDADIYVGWLNRDLFLAGEKLKWIQSPSSGINYYLAIPELVESDVLVTSARGTHGACLAESTFGMILAFTRCIKDFVLTQQEREWSGRRFRKEMIELTGSTMGIIGLGVAGRAIAKRAHAFDMRVIAVDLYPSDKPDHVAELWGLESLDDLLRESDYVVVTVPYTEQTKNMLGKDQLANIKPGAMLIGISRGKIIDETALVAALRDGRISAAALDVFAQEPLPDDSELWGIENLLITPHAAGGTQFEGERVLEILSDNLGRFLRGQFPLRNQADKQRGF